MSNLVPKLIVAIARILARGVDCERSSRFDVILDGFEANGSSTDREMAS